MPRLLLIDDDRFILRELQKLLSAEGYYCASAVTAESARRALAGSEFDLVLLDLGLPDTDGLTLCRQLRRAYRMPILLLTARSESLDKVIGPEVGADDYITKPFDPRELVARVRAQLRRAQEYSRPPERSERIPLANLVLDVGAREVKRDAETIPLTEREFELLSFFARYPGQALASERIFENVWGYGADLGVETLKVHIQRVRRKIETDPANPKILLTVRGYGYKLASAD